MSLEAQPHNEHADHSIRAGAESPEDAYGFDLAGYVMARWGSTLRLVLLTLMPIALLTTVALIVAVFVAPESLLPLAVLAGGSAAIAGYVLVRAGRRAFTLSEQRTVTPEKPLSPVGPPDRC